MLSHIKKRKKAVFFTILFLIFIAILFIHNVSKNITYEDEIYIKKYLINLELVDTSKLENIKFDLTYKQQIELIKAIQADVLFISPSPKSNEGIPRNQLRNPKNLYTRGLGICYDRSYVLEKIFKYLGFSTRHIFLFKDKENIGILEELLTSQIPTHASTEILTNKGWLIVDSNHSWISIDKDYFPYSMKSIIENNEIDWLTIPPKEFKGNYQPIYGLYSRHGRFFPPFNFIPDYRLQELIYNFRLIF